MQPDASHWHAIFVGHHIIHTEGVAKSSHLVPSNVSLSAKREIAPNIHDVSFPVVRWPFTRSCDAARSIVGGLPNSFANAR